MKSILKLPLAGCLRIAANGSRLGEVAEHKTSLGLQILKFSTMFNSSKNVQ